MAVIDWTQTRGGDWADGANWAGGVVPGAGDTADITTKGRYDVVIDTPVSVGALLVRDGGADLYVDDSLTTPSLTFKGGKLQLDKGTLSGNVDDQSGKFFVENGTSTLQDVSWTGVFEPTVFRASHGQPASTLTIAGSFTLAPASGTGPGQGVISGDAIFQGLTTLDNAQLEVVGLSIVSSPTLTLGTSFVLTAFNTVSLSGGETLVNDGEIVHPNVVTGPGGNGPAAIVINNGQIDQGAKFGSAQVTNNGTITAEAGDAVTVNLQTWQAPGASGAIVLDSGTVAWVGAANLTTAQLLGLDATQNVTTQGSFGFAVGKLDNTGATLDIGQGTTLGTLSGTLPAVITGGTVALSGTAPALTNATLQTLTLTGGGALATSDVTLSHVTLSGITSLTATNTLDLAGVVLSGPGAALAIAATGAAVEIGAHQSFDGISLAVTQGVLTLDPGAVLQDTAVYVGGTSTLTFAEAATASKSATLAASTTITTGTDSYVQFAGGDAAAPLTSGLSLGGDLRVIVGDPYVSYDTRGTVAGPGYLTNSGDIALSGATSSFVMDNFSGNEGYLTNTGTITDDGGLIVLNTSRLTNTGSISVTNGTLVLGGALTTGSLTAYLGHGSQLEVGGDLDLGGKTITLGTGGTPSFSLVSGSIDDGTFVVRAGTKLTEHTGSGSIVYNATVVNDGTIAAGGEEMTTFNQAISGQGTIQLSGDSSVVIIGATVAAGQTVSFTEPGKGASYAESLTFLSPQATTAFAGTLTDFAVSDVLVFIGETITSGVFSGDSIIVGFGDSTNVTLATSTALSGSLSIGGDELTYKSQGMDVGDWSPTNAAARVADPADASGLRAAALSNESQPYLADWLPTHAH